MLALQNNLSLIFPSTNSSTNKTYKKYIFSPLTRDEKITFSFFMSLLCCFAIVANAAILYYSKQRGWRQNKQRRGAFKRSLTHYFVQSLAWSDFLCSVTVPLIFIGQLFVEIALKEWSCKLLRYLSIFFPTVTLTNLMVIGAERYIAVFHPFFVITNRAAKKAIFIAWMCGGIVTLIPSATYKVIRQDVGPDSYTLICKYDRRIPLYRILIMGFTCIVYIIPSLILVVSSIRIIRYLSQRKLFLKKKNKATSKRFKKTGMFLKLIFSYVIPYFLYVVYIIIYMATNGEIGHKEDFIIRRCSAFLSFSNSVVNPIIFYSNMGGLRKMLRDLTNRFRYFISGYFRGNVVRTESTPCRADGHVKEPHEAWRNRKRRNGMSSVGMNIVLPIGNNDIVCYDRGSQLTTFTNKNINRQTNS